MKLIFLFFPLFLFRQHDFRLLVGIYNSVQLGFEVHLDQAANLVCVLIAHFARKSEQMTGQRLSATSMSFLFLIWA